MCFRPCCVCSAVRGAGDEGLKKLRLKLRETYEHRPKKLQIAVDGEVRGVQTITSASSKLQIKLPPLSKPGFVEILSEQGLGLLYFDLQQETLEVPAPRVAAVDLSDGRQLSVSLTLVGGAPVIDVAYYDPLLEGGVDGPPSAQAPVSEPLDLGFGEAQQSGVEPCLKVVVGSPASCPTSRDDGPGPSRFRWACALVLCWALPITEHGTRRSSTPRPPQSSLSRWSEPRGWSLHMEPFAEPSHLRSTLLKAP